MLSHEPPGAPDHTPLVLAAQRGDRDAFGQLYVRFARAVHGVLLARLPHAQAEDLVQEVFMQAFTRLRDLREPGAFAGWICAIARRRAADAHRRGRPTEVLADTLASPDRPDVVAEAQLAIAAIRALPEAYQETLALRLIEGLTGPEIAVATGLTPDSVRVNLHRGFRLLREKLGAKA